jgi:hypothetical protein
MSKKEEQKKMKKKERKNCWVEINGAFAFLPRCDMNDRIS